MNPKSYDRARVWKAPSRPIVKQEGRKGRMKSCDQIIPSGWNWRYYWLTWLEDFFKHRVSDTRLWKSRVGSLTRVFNVACPFAYPFQKYGQKDAQRDCEKDIVNGSIAFEIMMPLSPSSPFAFCGPSGCPFWEYLTFSLKQYTKDGVIIQTYNRTEGKAVWNSMGRQSRMDRSIGTL